MKWSELPSPCYIIDEEKLKENLTILRDLELVTGCHVLLAQKAFSMYSLYPLIGKYISGTTSSGLYEARLSHEEMGKENHVFAPAYSDSDARELARICDHVIFNSFSQYKKHRETMKSCSIGLRINPECSTQEGHAIYDPCAPYSRLGITFSEFERGLAELGAPKKDGVYKLPTDIEGLHFHTLCEQDSGDLVKTFLAFEERFLPYIKQVHWINLGGGHHITREGYHLGELRDLINYIQNTYSLTVYIEPGEAIALNAGYLMTTVCDIVHNGMDILILDTSAECHMPDVIEMPYTPPLYGARPAGELPYTYRLSSISCLAGDVIGDYSFPQEVRVGDRLIFEDMGIYTMVKNNTFNGIPLPAIVLHHGGREFEIVRQFTYEDFKCRLS